MLLSERWLNIRTGRQTIKQKIHNISVYTSSYKSHTLCVCVDTPLQPNMLVHSLFCTSWTQTGQRVFFFFGGGGGRHFWESLSSSVSLRKEAHGMLIPLETAGFSPTLSPLSLTLSGFILPACVFVVLHTTRISTVHQKTSDSLSVVHAGVGRRMQDSGLRKKSVVCGFLLVYELVHVICVIISAVST